MVRQWCITSCSCDSRCYNCHFDCLTGYSLHLRMLHLGHHRILHQGEKSWRGSSATSTATTDWRPGYNAGYSRLQPRLQWLPSSATSDCPWCPVPPALPWSSTALPCLKRLTSTQMLFDFLFCAIICQTVIYFHRGQLCIILQTHDFRRPQVRELSKKK